MPVKVVTPLQTETRKNGDSCLIREYPTNNARIDGVIAEIDGRYPEKGMAENEISTMAVFVLDGEGQIVTEGATKSIGPGFFLIVPAGERYFWRGKLQLFVSSTPKWVPEQHVVHVEQEG